MAKSEANPWTVLESRTVYDNPWLTLIEHRVLTPHGRPGIYGVVSPKKKALGIVPFTAAGQIVLIGQYRFPLGRYSWEIPEGGGDKTETAQASAARELKEETGYTAKSWREILRLDLSNSITDEEATVFLAWDLVPGVPEPDETEKLDLREVAFEEAYRMVMAGTITDAISVAALLKVKALAREEALPPEIAAHI